MDTLAGLIERFELVPAVEANLAHELVNLTLEAIFRCASADGRTVTQTTLASCISGVHDFGGIATCNLPTFVQQFTI